MNPEPLPTDTFVNHPDHRFVGQAMLDVTVTGGTTAAIFPDLAKAEGLQPWRGLEETWLFGPGGGATAVDVSGTIDRKLTALECHRSQGRSGNVRALISAPAGRLRQAAWRRYAESFRVIRYRR